MFTIYQFAEDCNVVVVIVIDADLFSEWII